MEEILLGEIPSHYAAKAHCAAEFISTDTGSG
jgi:hypothetical protein